MPVTINGTTGIAGVDGSAGTPSVQGTDSNTGIFFPAADTIAFAEGGAEVARFDSSGNFGLGVTPSAWGSGQKALQIGVGTGQDAMFWSGGNDTEVLTNAYNNSGWKYQTTGGNATRYAQSGGFHYWFNAPSGTAGNAITWTQAMTLDTSGNLLVGGTGVIVYSKVLSQFDGATKYGFVANDTSNAASVGFAAFAVNGTSTSGAIGSITRNGSASSVLYNTTSDERLKENIADADAALGTVAAIKVRKYDWKEGGQHEDYGFIAQELAEVVNNVVSKGRTEDDMWAVDYGKLTPLLCKAIQEQQALIESLTARIAALEAA